MYFRFQKEERSQADLLEGEEKEEVIMCKKCGCGMKGKHSMKKKAAPKTKKITGAKKRPAAKKARPMKRKGY